MRKYLHNKLFLLYLSKGITFLSTYLLIIILFNRLPAEQFSSYSAITYYTFIIYTILDFGYSNYVILNREINTNEELLVNLHKQKVFVSIIIAIAFTILAACSGSFYFLLIPIIAVQQALNFDGFFKIKNKYQVIITKYFLIAFSNFVLIALAFYVSLSYKTVVVFTCTVAMLINAATLPQSVKAKILRFKRERVRLKQPKLNKDALVSLFFYISFNFLNNFTYSYYAYALKSGCESSYYNSNMLYLNLISNFYVLFIICREYIFTTGNLNSYVINVAMAGFLVTGCFALFNYGAVISFFGKNVTINPLDKIIACVLFLTLIVKTETYFHLLKNSWCLKIVTIVQLVLNAVLFGNVDKLTALFGKRHLLLPLAFFDCIVIAVSIAAFLFYKRIRTAALSTRFVNAAYS